MYVPVSPLPRALASTRRSARPRSAGGVAGRSRGFGGCEHRASGTLLQPAAHPWTCHRRRPALGCPCPGLGAARRLTRVAWLLDIGSRLPSPTRGSPTTFTWPWRCGGSSRIAGWRRRSRADGADATPNRAGGCGRRFRWSGRYDGPSRLAPCGGPTGSIREKLCLRALSRRSRRSRKLSAAIARTALLMRFESTRPLEPGRG